MKTAVGILAVCCLLLSCGPSSNNEELLVFAAASTAEALTAALEAFTTETEIVVRVNAAGSSVLAQQIEQGAPADVFLSANADWVEYLEERERIAEKAPLLGNRLVLVAPATAPESGLRTPADLVKRDVETIALADPEAVPAGIYAKQALTALGLWDQVRGKSIPAADVREALRYVERGEVDAGIVYATDVAASTRVRKVFVFPEDAQNPIVLTLALLKRENGSAAARELFDYLRSKRAARVFQTFGFTWVADGAPETH